MRLDTRRLIAALTAAALLAMLAPAAALARPATRAARLRAVRAGHMRPGGLRAAALDSGVPTAPPDAFDPKDDTAAGARNLSAIVGGDNPGYGFGKASYNEAHSFYVASDESTPGAKDYKGDQDWFYFDVSARDIDPLVKDYLIEAHTRDSFVDPVVEVYGPTKVASLTATPPDQLVDGGGIGLTDYDVGNPQCVAANDSGLWYAGYSASTSFTPRQPGRYFVRVRPAFYDFTDPPERGYLDSAGSYTLRLKVGQFTRLAGSGRVQTAVEMSKERYADNELSLIQDESAVVIANGWNYPDALAGSTLAGAVNGPLLLTHPDYLDPDVHDEIVRLGAQRAFILGGTAALNASVEASLVKLLGRDNVIRVKGDNRVQTAAAIAARAATEASDTGLGLSRVAFVANGWSFPDALAASPMAAWNIAPILLTHSGSLDPDALKAIRTLGITDVVILGSTSAVAGGVETALKHELGASHVARIGGGDRYETAKKFAVWATGDRGLSTSVGSAFPLPDDELAPLEWEHFGLAAGYNYPDALGGGAFTGLAGFPLLLNPQAGLSPWVLDLDGVKDSYLHLSIDEPAGYAGSVGRSYIFGSDTVIAPGVWTYLDGVTGMPAPEE